MMMLDGWTAVLAVWVGVIMMMVEGGSAVSSNSKLNHSSFPGHADCSNSDSEVSMQLVATYQYIIVSSV